jgi:Hydrazine synthase alpha subunit middle domain
VAAQPRAPQTNILDRTVAGEGFDPTLVGEGLGLLDIRNVYDLDGTLGNTGTPAAANTAALADPLQRIAAQRPARFLRIEKAVSLGDDELGFPDLASQAFGISNFMREIIGYVPIEPDGSVSVRVPANVAFVVSVLDANGQRAFPQHRAWLSLRPGEVRRCKGCHQAVDQTDRSHGRDGTSNVADPAWGAVLSGAPFPNTLPLTAANAQLGDTMAQARARTSCVAGSTCSQRPSVNVLFDDVWTDPIARPADASFAWTYASPGLATPPPVRSSCMSSWSSTCRVIVNYVRHIQPIWTLDRGTNGSMTCTNCHAPADVAGAIRLAAGQLDLTGGPSAEEQLHVTSYRELFFADTVQDLFGGVLVDRTVTVVVDTDPVTGLPITEVQPVNATRPLVPGNARGSRFFTCFAANNSCVSGDPNGAGGTVNHNGLLTPSELRLISEWVDIGAQYFNNPFDPDVPLD